jgi:prepilin-type processing-associated H-X9-DG protein
VPKEKDKLPAMGGMFSNGFHVLMCDGSVRLVANAVTPDVFRPMITPRGRD